MGSQAEETTLPCSVAATGLLQHLLPDLAGEANWMVCGFGGLLNHKKPPSFVLPVLRGRQSNSWEGGKEWSRSLSVLCQASASCIRKSGGGEGKLREEGWVFFSHYFIFAMTLFAGGVLAVLTF